jgi:hypothetical protein
MLIRFVDELTPWHLRVLRMAADPNGWFEAHPELQRPNFATTSSHSHMLEAALPELQGRQDLYDQIAQDLVTRGLGRANLHATMSANGAWSGWATSLGRQSVRFVTAPAMTEQGAKS